MIVQCDQCATRYQVPDEKLSAAGTKARCKQCGHIMTLYRPGPEEPAEVPRVPATAAEVPVAPDPPRPVAKRASRQKARAAPIVTWR
ncbi:MAG: zinc-ribbon domain-containing protein, partial [Candidatus Tectimicrobiota bacterium]